MGLMTSLVCASIHTVMQIVGHSPTDFICPRAKPKSPEVWAFLNMLLRYDQIIIFFAPPRRYPALNGRPTNRAHQPSR